MNLAETAEVLTAIASLRERRSRMALATIVSVRGSTYRRAGARLLVPEEGEPIGNLSGGCLEGEVEQVARQVMSDGRPRLRMYDLTADDEVVWGWGLGCNGAIEVFIEPAGKAAEVADALRLAIAREHQVAVATVLESTIPGIEPGERLVVDRGGQAKGSWGQEGVQEAVSAAVSWALAEGTTSVESLSLADGDVRVFIEVLQPPLRLVVCGAGHDAIPVVRFASELGWKVVVVDDRESFLDPERFPGAGFVLSEPGKAADQLDVDSRTYVIVMSHNYLRDRDYLRSFLSSEVAYIGMLGPRARLERLLQELSREGGEVGAGALDRVHGPAGLDVGGEGPEEIAAAIVTEVLAVNRGRAGGFLRARAGPIHDRRQPVARGAR